MVLCVRPKTHHRAVEVHMPFGTKEREAEVWNFKGKAGHLKVGEKEQICGKQVSGSPRSSGAQRGVQQTGFARFLPSAAFSSYYDAEVMLPSCKQVFTSEFL